MTVRTTSMTVTFVHPFNLSGTDEVQPAGIYTVETDEELLQPAPASSSLSRRLAAAFPVLISINGHVDLRGHGLFSTGSNVGSNDFGFML